MSGDPTPRVVVAGAGVAGLAAAVSLATAGCRVVVLESSAQVRETGAGLVLTANGVTAAAALGIAGQLHTLGESGLPVRQVDPQGRPVWEAPRDVTVTGIHQRVLHTLLWSALPAQAHVRPGCRVTAVDPGDQGARAVVHYTHEGRSFSETADLVVGADGTGSTVRDQLYPGLAPVYTGRTCWQGVVPLVPGHRGFTVASGPSAEFGVLPIAADRSCWYGYVRAPRRAVLADERAMLRGYFQAWGDPVREVLAQVRPDALVRHDVHAQRRPLPSYVHGRVVLLGDAAHTMTPTLGQGANSTLEDAATLGPVVGPSLLEGVGLSEALARFDRSRRPRTQRMVRESNRSDAAGTGLGRPSTTALRNAALRRVPARWTAAHQAWLTDWRVPDPGRAT